MFFRFEWFSESDVGEMSEQVAYWLRQTPELEVFFAKDQTATGWQKRAVTEEEIQEIEKNIQRVSKGEIWGGCFIRDGKKLLGLSFFSMASGAPTLDTLIFMPTKFQFPPYQHPILHQVLANLSDDLPERYRRFKLGLGLPSLEDRKILALNNLKYAEDLDEWQNTDGTFEFNRLDNFSTLDTETLVQLTITMKEAFLDGAKGSLSRYSYRRRMLLLLDKSATQIESNVLKVNTDVPVKVQIFLPLIEENELNQQLAFIQSYLGFLAQFESIPPVAGEQIPFQQLQDVWKSDQIFEIGKFAIIDNAEKALEVSDRIPLVIPQTVSEIFALGTAGPHPTTEICLQLIGQHLNPAEHRKVLDLGTGTGILAIAAAKLGAERILALDANPLATQSTQENIVLNNVSDQIQAYTGSIGIVESTGQIFYAFDAELQKPPAELDELTPLDMIISNTLPHVLKGHAQNFWDKLRPAGLLLVSGIEEELLAGVEKALSDKGFELVDKRELNKWYGLVFRKNELSQ